MCTNWWTCLCFICLLACVPSTRYLVSRGVSVLVLTVRQRPFLGLFVACRCLALTKHQHRLPPKSHNWPRSRNITARSIIVSHSLLILNSPLMYRHVYLCLCVRVPCIHRQKGCGREGILIWRNVSRASLWDDLRETEGRSGRGGMGRGWGDALKRKRCCEVCVSLSLTQRVAARCGTLHVEVVALVETPSLGPVGKVVGGGLFERQLFG